MVYATDPVAELYRQTGVKPPVLSRPIAPLGELIGSFNLYQVELVGLTGQSVAQYLAANSGPVSQLADASDEPLAGFLYATRSQAALFVEHADLLVRRRFSAAHELGHYWLHYVLQRDATSAATDNEPVIFVDAFQSSAGDDTDQEEADQSETTVKLNSKSLPPQNQMEREADLFAARLLMPAALVRALVARYRPGFEGENLVRRLATELLVSRQAVRIRLRGLGLLG
jgi:hypothetical protein